MAASENPSNTTGIFFDEPDTAGIRKDSTDEPALQTALLTRLEEFQAMKLRWNQLAASTRSDLVFLRHEWFDAALEWLAGDVELRIVCVFREREVVGICPLMLRRDRYHGLPVRRLEFIAIPDTQQCDLLAAPEDHMQVVAAVAARLSREARSWDVLDLRHLGARSPTATVLAWHLRRTGIACRTRPGGSNPWISLEGGWQAFYAGRSRRLKKNNNLVANRLRNSGTLEVRHYDGKLPAEKMAELLDTLGTLSARSWNERTGLTLDNPGPRRFLLRLVEHASRENWLSVWLLYIGHQPAAMELQLAYRGQVHALRADFDQSLQHVSPGSYLNWKLLEQLFETGAQRYLMGPGNNAYKLRWTEEAELLVRATGYSRTLRGRMLDLLETRIRPVLARLLKREAASTETGKSL